MKYPAPEIPDDSEKNRARIGYCQKWSGRVSGTRQALVVEVWAELFFLAFASFFNRQTYLSVDVVIMRGGFLIGSAVAGSFKDKYICCIRKQILILCYIRSLYNEGKLQQMVKGVQHMSGTCRLPFTVYNLTGSEQFQMNLNGRDHGLAASLQTRCELAV